MERKKVLVVEDDTDTRELTELFLTQNGFEVTAVPSMEAAISTLKTQQFAALLTDYSLGSSDDAYDLLQSAGATLPPVTILITGHADFVSGNPLGIKLAGFDAYFVKPVNMMSVIATLRTLIRQKQAANV